MNAIGVRKVRKRPRSDSFESPHKCRGELVMTVDANCTKRSIYYWGKQWRSHIFYPSRIERIDSMSVTCSVVEHILEGMMWLGSIFGFKKTLTPAFLNISFWEICILGSSNLNVTRLRTPFEWSCDFLYLHVERWCEVFHMRSARVGLFCSSTDSSSFDRFGCYEISCMNSVANGEEFSGW